MPASRDSPRTKHSTVPSGSCIRSSAGRRELRTHRAREALERSPKLVQSLMAREVRFDRRLSRDDELLERDRQPHVAGVAAIARFSSFFSTMTVDQSAKWITVERLGSWAAGRDSFEVAEVLMFVGTNPLVSLSTFNFALQHPVRRCRVQGAWRQAHRDRSAPHRDGAPRRHLPAAVSRRGPDVHGRARSAIILGGDWYDATSVHGG